MHAITSSERIRRRKTDFFSFILNLSLHTAHASSMNENTISALLFVVDIIIITVYYTFVAVCSDVKSEFLWVADSKVNKIQRNVGLLKAKVELWIEHKKILWAFANTISYHGIVNERKRSLLTLFSLFLRGKKRN